MNTSVDNFAMNILEDAKPLSSTILNVAVELSENNLKQLLNLHSFFGLQENWDSYGAKKPSPVAILKAVNFIVQELNPFNFEVFFSAPTADGDIVVEIKNLTYSIEIIFSRDVPDKIICSCNDELHAEENLNETTFNSYTQWLFN